MPFTTIAKKIHGQPSFESLSSGATLGAMAGSFLGNKLQNHAARKAFAKKFGGKSTSVEELRELSKKQWGDANPITGAYMEALRAKNPEDKMDAIESLMSEMHLREAEGQLGRLLENTRDSKGYISRSGMLLGGAIGAAAPMAARSLAVKRLAKKLRAGTAIAGAGGGVGALALYKRNKEKKASWFGPAVRTLSSWRPSTWLNNLKASRQLAGKAVTNPLAEVATGSGILEGTSAHRRLTTTSNAVTKERGWFPWTKQEGFAAPTSEVGVANAAGETQWSALSPNQVLPTHLNNAPVQMRSFNASTGQYMPPVDLRRPIQIPANYTARPAQATVIPSVQQRQAAAAAAPPPVAPPAATPPAPAPPVGKVRRTKKGAQPVVPPTAQPAAPQSAPPTQPPAPAVPTSPADLAAKAANTAEDASWVKKITDSLPDGPAKDFAVKHGATIAMIMAPLVAHMGERAAFNVAMKQTMEKAAPWAAGGLAAGAGFGMLSNRSGD